jgi:hypothetical protein
VTETATNAVEDGMGVVVVNGCTEAAGDMIEDEDMEWMGLGGEWYRLRPGCTEDGTALRTVVV